MGSFTELDMREKDKVADIESVAQGVAVHVDGVMRFLADIPARMQRAKKERLDNEYMEGLPFAIHLAATHCKKRLKTHKDSECFDADDVDTYNEFERLVIARREERIATTIARRQSAQSNATTIETDQRSLSATDTAMVRALVQEIVESAQKTCALKIQSNDATMDEQADKAPREVLTFVEIRQMVKKAKISFEEAVELCKRLANTIYPNGGSSNCRQINEIDEARLLELAEDYARAAENEDVAFLCKYICNSKENLLERETVFVNLVLRNANPADVKEMVIRSFIRELIKCDKREMAMRPRICDCKTA